MRVANNKTWLIVALLFIAFVDVKAQSDWLQWGGPNRNFTSPAGRLEKSNARHVAVIAPHHQREWTGSTDHVPGQGRGRSRSEQRQPAVESSARDRVGTQHYNARLGRR